MTGPRGRAPTPRTATPRLPRSAHERLARFEHATAHPSFLTVPAAYGLRTAGFEAVGDVMGCIAFQVSHQYVGLCGTRKTYRSAMAPPIVTFDSNVGSAQSSYPRQLRGAYATALGRLRDEARALDADGVVGIDVTMRHHDLLHEVVAVGSAVRTRGRTRATRVFTTDLPGDDVAKLLFAGWVPVELHTVIEVGIRHDDAQTLRQAGRTRFTNYGNAEVSGWTELRQRTVQNARSKLGRAMHAAGADGALLSSLDFSTWHRHCMVLEGHGDHVGQVIATGTSIARFAGASTAAPTPLTILPVGKGTR